MKLVNAQYCTGCFACVQACPKKCITMKYDNMGNSYPVIENAYCIECGNCTKVCPEKNQITYKPSIQAYAAWSLNKDCRKKSASGGIAAEFYEFAVANNYIICGVEYQKDFHVMHSLTKDKAKIEKFQQSKYVYPEIGETYKKIKKLLSDGNRILFISLPCKVAGLKSFLGKNYDNLVTVDIICHGTPPYKFLKEHILKKSKVQKAYNLKFRDENEFKFCLKDQKGKTIYSRFGKSDTYLAAFLEGLSYRESCYQCQYARPERISDITIGDFWGLGVEKSWNHPYTGSISAVLINTEKGKNFWRECSDRFFTEERSVEEAVKGNAQLNHPTLVHPKRTEFETLYKLMGFEKAVENCLQDEIKYDRKKQRKAQFHKNLRKIVGIIIPYYRR